MPFPFFPSALIPMAAQRPNSSWPSGRWKACCPRGPHTPAKQPPRTEVPCFFPDFALLRTPSAYLPTRWVRFLAPASLCHGPPAVLPSLRDQRQSCRQIIPPCAWFLPLAHSRIAGAIIVPFFHFPSTWREIKDISGLPASSRASLSYRPVCFPSFVHCVVA